MLQSRRILKALFLCLITAGISEQSLGGQGGQTKKNVPQQQQRQLQQQQGGAASRQDDEIKAVLQHKARDMRQHMNLNQEPCKDFYEYVCGNWLQAQNVSHAKEGDTISVTEQLERRINVQLQDLLNGPAKKTAEGYDDTVAKDFYRSCNQAAASSPDQREYIKKFVEHYGGLPYVRDSQWQEKHYNWIQVIGQLKHSYNLDILISLSIPKYSLGRAVPIPILEEPQQTILPPQLCSFLAAQNNEQEEEEIFNSIQMEIRDNLRAWLDLEESDATRLAGDIQRFEFELCKYMRKREWLEGYPNGSGNRSRATSNQITPNKLHGVLQNRNNEPQHLHVLETEYKVEFTRFVQTSLGKGHSTPRDFYLRDRDYFRHLSTIARKGLTPSFAYYIMYRALTELTIPLNQPRAERPFYCVRKAMLFFPDILGSLYQTKYRREMVLSDLRDLLKTIAEAFFQSVDMTADWLQKNFRSDIKQRLRSWRIKEPEYQASEVVDLQLDPSANYWKSQDAVMEHSAKQYLQQLSSYSTTIRHPVEEFVNVFPSNTEVRLQFSWALLQPPFYGYNYPRSLKFATLGYIMAREMVKHYDQQGWLDSPAPLVNSWDTESMLGFLQNKECFRTQVSNYLFNKPDVFRNGTQLRDIAVDTSAVNIAFAAYIRWLQEQDINSEELQYETLPDMNFSNTQLFFVHYGQSRCAARVAAAATPDFFPLDRHTPERMTINVPLSNSNELGRDFSCPIGADMNVADKCLIF